MIACGRSLVRFERVRATTIRVFPSPEYAVYDDDVN